MLESKGVSFRMAHRSRGDSTTDFTVNGIDEMAIEAELTSAGFAGAYGGLERLVRRIKTSVQNEVLASPKAKQEENMVFATNVTCVRTDEDGKKLPLAR